MALIKCSECGKMISERAAACPNCGCPTAALVDDSTHLSRADSVISPAGVVTDKLPLQDTITYLEHAMELEKTIYTYDMMRRRLVNRINSLGHSKTFQKPYGVDFSAVFEIWWVFMPITFFLFIGICIFDMINSDNFIIAFFNLEIFRIAKVSFITGISVWAGISVLYLISQAVGFARSNKTYNNNLKADKKRLLAEAETARHLTAQVNTIDIQLRVNKALLKRLYSVDVIYPTFQNMVAVVTMLEYFKSGICSSLTGTGGAYDKYSYEKILNSIDGKLDTVINMLEDIREQHVMLYNAIQESISISESVYQQAEVIGKAQKNLEANSALIAYNTQRIERNTRISSYVDMFGH